MKPKYWTILILASAAIIVSIFYYLRQPAPYSGPIVVPSAVKTQSQASATSFTPLAPLTHTTTSTSPVALPPATQPQPGTSTWQTYTNIQYGFSFVYPVISEEDYTPVATQEVSFQNASSTVLSFDSNNFYIEIQVNKNKMGLEDWFEKEIDNNGILFKNGNAKVISMNGIQVIEMVGHSALPDEYVGDGGLPFDDWYLSTPDGNYIISYNYDYQDYSLTDYGIMNGFDLGEKILLTFKFTK